MYCLPTPSNDLDLWKMGMTTFGLHGTKNCLWGLGPATEAGYLDF